MTEGFDVRWTSEHGAPRAVLFEPHDEVWSRTEFEWTGDDWREIGCEHATEVACFGSDSEYSAPDGPRPHPVKDDGEDDA
ncbi:hypothetical protein [Halomontanus rarus]|uniref:hypothetical protein n=1 Tax=Halomontanus rarus TaxID=3034020 RepID=UPI0023E7B273|nr:hypothetical protein [Halovivax sp. TS33]